MLKCSRWAGSISSLPQNVMQEYEEQKFAAFRPLMFYSSLLSGFLAAAFWVWDWAVDAVHAPQTLKWRLAMGASIWLTSTLYLLARLPRQWFFISVIAGGFGTVGTWVHVAGTLDQGFTFGAGGYVFCLIMPMFIILGIGRRQSVITFLLLALDPYIFYFIGIGVDQPLKIVSAYIWPTFGACTAFVFLLDFLYQDIFIMRHQLIEEKNRAENATRLKDQFVSLVSHDLKSPLGSIRGYMDISLKTPGAPAEMYEYIRHARGAADIQLNIIESLLDMSRVQTGILRPEIAVFGLRALVEDKIRKLAFNATNKGITISNEIPEGATLTADQSLMGIVISNLIDNAIKFTLPGGAVSVSLPEERTIRVRDNGAGVPARMLANLFKHEVRTSGPGTAGERGTGLGLPLSHDIVAAHGGQLTVETEPGRGSAFYVRLPHAPPGAAAQN